MRLFRLARIAIVSLRFGLDQMILDGASSTTRTGEWLRRLIPHRRFRQARGERLRLALESLGPIFVKFGQVLSTRRDLLPLDIADELAQLQDNVDRKSTRLNSSHNGQSRMPSSA